MDPISGVGMQGMVVAQLATAAPAPSAIDATRFAEMVQPAAAPAAAAAGTIPVPSVGQTPGDSILNGMSSVGTEFRDSWTAMQQALARPAGEMTTADMLRLQMHMVQLSVQVEMVGKVISKATQNLDQLAKLQ
jgi:type III secretion system YscI/HrpB-like protein